MPNRKDEAALFRDDDDTQQRAREMSFLCAWRPSIADVPLGTDACQRTNLHPISRNLVSHPYGRHHLQQQAGHQVTTPHPRYVAKRSILQRACEPALSTCFHPYWTSLTVHKPPSMRRHCNNQAHLITHDNSSADGRMHEPDSQTPFAHHPQTRSIAPQLVSLTASTPITNAHLLKATACHQTGTSLSP